MVFCQELEIHEQTNGWIVEKGPQSSECAWVRSISLGDRGFNPPRAGGAVRADMQTATPSRPLHDMSHHIPESAAEVLFLSYYLFGLML